MKITVVGSRGFPNVQGGIESHCEHLYTHLSHKGCDVIVYTRKPYVNIELKSYKGISLIPVSCPKSKFFEAIFHTFKGIIKAHKLEPDILHIHGIGPSVLTPLARLLGLKVVVTHHGPDYKRKKWSRPAKIFLKFCEWIGMNFADNVIAIAENIAEDIKRKFGRDATVIPNGVVIAQKEKTDIILKQFNLEKGKYILAVGRFVPEKGFHDLISSFNKVDFEHLKLVIVGDADHVGEYSRDLKVNAESNKNIIFTGFLSGQPLREIYSHAGLFVLPSYFEGLPIVLLEAMSYGLPCIASDIPANRNVELNNDRFFKTGDTEMLAEKIMKFIDNPWEDGEREQLFDLINEKYNWGKIADETLKVYERILS